MTKNEKEKIKFDVQELVDLMKHADSKDKDLVKKAFEFSLKSHDGQYRESGDPYFSHVFETAKILADFGMGARVIATGLLHDVIEDTDATGKVIKREFGEEIFFLIEGVTKLGKLKYRGMKRHTESLRKFFIATSEDVRVLIIRLADRLHNMRTLEHLPEEKQIRKSKETIEIFAPLAYRLGMRVIHKELEDLAFSFLMPQEYKETAELLKQRKKRDMRFLEKFDKSLKKALAKAKLTKFKTSFRIKGLYSLYQKLKRKDGDIGKIYDITAMRVITESVADCYQILGVIHSIWKPLPGRLKDYIGCPKPNDYQSIHTTIFTGDGGIVEIQIRTKEMHEIAEMGVASHLSYKGNRSGDIISQMMRFKNVIPLIGNGEKKEKPKAPEWIKELGSEFSENEKSERVVEELKTDFFEHRVFVFTPNGDVIDLPIDSSPIDFAYSVHTYIGNHLSGAKINGKMASLDTKLQNGDRVEIITKKTAKPNRKWLEFVKTSEARRNIKSKLKLTKQN